MNKSADAWAETALRNKQEASELAQHVISQNRQIEKLQKALDWVMAETATRLEEKQEMYMRDKVADISGYRTQF